MSLKRIFGKALRSPLVLGSACLLGVGGATVGTNNYVHHDMSAEAIVQDDTTEKYRDRLQKLNEVSKFDLQFGINNDDKIIQRDLIMDKNINEREYKAFAEYFPKVGTNHLGASPSQANSLDECRVAFGDAGIAGSDKMIADNIIECMNDNNSDALWLTVLAFVMSTLGMGAGAVTARKSEKIKKWSEMTPSKGN